MKKLMLITLGCMMLLTFFHIYHVTQTVKTDDGVDYKGGCYMEKYRIICEHTNTGCANVLCNSLGRCSWSSIYVRTNNFIITEVQDAEISGVASYTVSKKRCFDIENCRTLCDRGENGRAYCKKQNITLGPEKDGIDLDGPPCFVDQLEE